ncbi:TPA: hypothetical protein DEW05_03840 [Candidatus Saccharibacteria bacterium]|nr:hypothetical protein [Candidatus Saccharibacteria bacterium]
MRGLVEQTIVWLVVVVFVGMAIHTPTTVFIETHWPHLELLAKSWKELVLGALLLLILLSLYKRGALRQVVGDKVVQLVAAIAVVHVALLLLFDNAYVSELAGLLIDLRFYLFFVELYVAARYIPGVHKYGLRAAAVGAAFIVVFGVLQVFVLPKDILASIGYSDATIKPYLTVDLNHDYVRINSTLRGPNPVGALAVLVLCVAGAWAIRRASQLTNWKKRAQVIATLLAGVIVLWASYSRSAWIAGALGIATLWASVVPKKLAVYSLISMAMASVIVVGVLLQLRDVPAISNLVFHNNPVGGSPTKSDDGHIESLEQGIEAASQAPLGKGIGSTGSASLLSEEPVIIENQYLFMAHESGWLGVALQLLLFGLVLWGLWRLRQDWLSLGLFSAGIGLAFIGLLLPVWADDTVSLYWWGLAGLALGSSAIIKSDERVTPKPKSHKKTARTT